MPRKFSRGCTKALRKGTMHRSLAKRPSHYALKVWTMVTRRGMTPALVARSLDISTWRVERILVGVSRRNVNRW